MNKPFEEYQNYLEYKFKNPNNLKTALTHSSYANENKSMKLPSNERLEFLGDSILNFVVSSYIYNEFPKLPEGEMTKIRANVVCEQTLKNLSNEIGIGEYLLLGKGEERTGGRARPSILADVFEALIGAIYTDGGFKEAERFILSKLQPLIIKAVEGCFMVDYKTTLQEELQKNGDVKIEYEVIKEKGPDHDKEFTVQIKCDGKVLGLGKGKSKKEAEQSAAKKALEKS